MSQGISGEGKSGNQKGHVVDLVIKDEELPSDEVTGQYVVSSGHHMLTADDVRGTAEVSPAGAQRAYQKQQSVAESVKSQNKQAVEPDAISGFSDNSAAGDKQFVPVRNLETLYNVSGKEAVTADSSASPGVSLGGTDEVRYTAEDEELDTLPSMDGMGIESGSVSSFGEAGINNESEFATSGSSSHRKQNDFNDEVIIKDAPLMAKAISTILSNES